MQHHLHQIAGRVLANASFDFPKLDRFGLSVVPIRVGAVVASRTANAGIIASELDPPQPDVLTIANRSGVTRTVSFGQILAGGWADRVVAESAQVLPRRTIWLPVAPLSPRWWNQGPLALAGQLEPALLALLRLAVNGGGGLRSVAQTALWDAYGHNAHVEPDATEQSWALLHGSTVLAGRLIAPIEKLPSRPAPGHESSCDPVVISPAGARTDDGVLRSLHLFPDHLEMTAVQATEHLVDVILAATALA